MLQLLGDELIASDRLAVFELVKNAYDADASQVKVRIDLNPRIEPTITVSDNGSGMTLDEIRSVWLVPGHDHRQKQRAARLRTPLHHRLPLGEKGLGRFAVHKLGNYIKLVTRASGSKECVVEIDWDQLIVQPYLDEAPVTIRVREPEVFTDNRTGTTIEIRQLRNKDWSRREIRRLHNQIVSMCSPFEEVGSFDAILQVPKREHWVSDLPDIHLILGRAIWTFAFTLNKGSLDWTYEFRGVPGLSLDGDQRTSFGSVLHLPDRGQGTSSKITDIVADEATTHGIGPIRGEFYVYDRDAEVIRRMPNTRVLTSYLDDAGGIRVYRDGIRVYNYGEPGDDWLGLDLRRVNSPSRRVSRNIVIGAIHLSLEHSTNLIEKTNREGFVENDAFARLQDITLGAISVLETERHIDKERIRSVAGRPGHSVDVGVEKHIADLRKATERVGMRKQLEPFIGRIEREYARMKETLLAAGMAGLNLAVIFHEIERGVRQLERVIVEEQHSGNSARQAQELVRLLDGFATLLTRGRKRQRTALELVSRVRQFNALRLQVHNVTLISPLLEGKASNFRAEFEFSLLLAALNNLVDNALYWLRVRWPDSRKEAVTSPRMLYIGVTSELPTGPAIVVADNGPGFQDDPDLLVRPFFTRKAEGMGLGLYYASLAMELNGGELLFPSGDDVGVPAEFDGAVVAMAFKGARR